MVSKNKELEYVQVTNENSDETILIYTYNFTGKTEYWNNRYLALNVYYSNLKRE